MQIISWRVQLHRAGLGFESIHVFVEQISISNFSKNNISDDFGSVQWPLGLNLLLLAMHLRKSNDFLRFLVCSP